MIYVAIEEIFRLFDVQARCVKQSMIRSEQNTFSITRDMPHSITLSHFFQAIIAATKAILPFSFQSSFFLFHIHALN